MYSKPVKREYSKLLPDCHLQSPIRKEIREYLVKDKNDQPIFIKDLNHTLPIQKTSLITDSEQIYGKLFKCTQSRININDWTLQNIPKCYDIMKDYAKVHIEPEFQDCIDYTKVFSNEILSMFSCKVEWEDIRSYMQMLKAKNSPEWKKLEFGDLGFDFILISRLYAIIKMDDKYYLLDYEQVMMICDTIAARVFSITYTWMLTDDTPGKLPIELLKDIYNVYDDLLTKDGNNAYNQIKTWEPSILAIILKKFDCFSMAGDFYKWLKTDLSSNFYYEADIMLNLVESYDLDINQLAELHGIFRHWGHPTVNEEEGCLKVKRIAKIRPPPKWTTIKKIKALLIRQFCISFIGITGKWPNIKISNKLRMTALGKSIESSNTTISLYSNNYSLDDWARIQFEKEFNFNYAEDFTQVIDDKSISCERKDIPSIYNMNKLNYKPDPSSTNRRVLIESLSRTNIDIKNICEIIMRREVPDSWKVILIHSKERELKISPRLFAMMTLEMRIYFCVTEMNLADQIFRYFPQQTMTMDESDLTKRMFSMASKKDFDAYIPIISSLDFKSWNIHWSYSSTAPFFETVDELFGTPGLYTYTHQFFSESLIALASHHNPPVTLIGLENYTKFKKSYFNPDECDTLWYNHKGGFEGLRQKGWTLITIGMLLLVEYMTGVRSYIVGQGDNQVCKLMIDKLDSKLDDNDFIKQNQEYLRNSVTSFLDILSVVASDIGLVIKEEESWVSSMLIQYGKDMLSNGAFLSQSIKRISRTMVDVNEIHPTLYSKIATLQTTGLATIQKGFSLFEAYILCGLETLVTILRDINFSLLIGHPITQNHKEISNNAQFLSFLLHLCSDVGNTPILPWISYQYRGHPDPLTSYLTCLDIGKENNCLLCARMITYLHDGLFKIGKANPELLLSNPTSLNIDSPALLSSLFRNELTTAIQRIVKNKAIGELFHMNIGKEEEEFYSYLIKSNPCYPRVLHEILLSSTIGSRLHFISKFYNTRTTQMLFAKDELSLYKKIVKGESDLVLYWWKFFLDVLKIDKKYSNICPTYLANRLRNKTWRNLVPDGIHGVTVPHPLHQMISSKVSGANHDNCQDKSEYILFQIPKIKDPMDMLLTRGSYPPYLGSKTKEKISGKIYQIPQTGNSLNCAKRLKQIQNWCVPKASRFSLFLDDLITTRTNCDPLLLELASGHITGGSYIHRLNDHITKRGTLNNFRPNITTHIYLSSDNFGIYSRGFENYNMHIQGMFHLGYAIIEHDIIHNNLNYGAIHLHTRCKSCTEPINELLITNLHDPPKLKMWENNPLLYTKVEETPIHLDKDNRLISYVKSSNGAHACGFLLVSRVLKHQNRQQWGVTEATSVFTSPIRIQDLIRYGIDKILLSFAYILCLYFFTTRSKLRRTLSITLTGDIWQDVATNCLLPEILPKLIEISGTSSSAELFTKKESVVRLLNRVVLKYLYQMEFLLKNMLYPVGLEFYIVPSCGIKKILSMWVQMIEFIFEIDNLYNDINPVIVEDSLHHNNLTYESIEKILIILQEKLSPYQMELINKSLKLKVSKVSPQDVFTKNIFVKLENSKIIKKESPSSLRPVIFQNDSPLWMKIPPQTLSKVPLYRPVDTSTRLLARRTYIDHQYHLSGDISGSHLKILEILLRTNFQSTLPSICLADGEGSISYLLSKLTNNYVIFNTLIDNKKLVLHRGVNYIPSSMALDSHNVKLAHLSALLGGDLTDDLYINELINQIPDMSYAILTMDAGSDVPFDSITKEKILQNTIKILSIRKIEQVIYRTYIDDIYHVNLIIDKFQQIYNKISIITPIFSSNENYEVYIHGIDRKSVILDIDYDLCPQLVDSSIISSKSSLIKLRKDRIKGRPHQTFYNEWTDILKQSYHLNYDFNIRTSIEYLILHTDIYETQNDLKSWLKRVKRENDNLMWIEMGALGKLEIGKKPTVRERMLLGADHVAHRAIENIMMVSLNCDVLLKVLDITNEDLAYDKIESTISKGICMKTEDNQVLYRWIPNVLEWRKLYLRYTWKVWGHVRWSNLVCI